MQSKHAHAMTSAKPITNLQFTIQHYNGWYGSGLCFPGAKLLPTLLRKLDDLLEEHLRRRRWPGYKHFRLRRRSCQMFGDTELHCRGCICLAGPADWPTWRSGGGALYGGRSGIFCSRRLTCSESMSTLVCGARMCCCIVRKYSCRFLWRIASQSFVLVELSPHGARAHSQGGGFLQPC